MNIEASWLRQQDHDSASLATADAVSKPTRSGAVVKMLPDVHVIKIGGQSIMDRGRKAVLPILEELVDAKQKGHRFILGVGGGTRARHVYSLGLDLDLPVAMLAKLGAAVPVQNARMLHMLLAEHGGIMCYVDHFEQLPLFLNSGCIPIVPGMPTFEYWEKSPVHGRIPPHRTDAGVYLLGEFLGAKSVLFIKDEDGLYSDDPKKNPDAEFIAETTAAELLASCQDELIVERVVLEYLQRADHVRSIGFVNGLKGGRILQALQGNIDGSVIRA